MWTAAVEEFTSSVEGHPRNPDALNNCDFLLRHVDLKEGRGAIIIYTCAAGVEGE